jgi:hypothetical protein
MTSTPSTEETSLPARRSIIPSRRNPMRPAFFFVSGALAAMLIGANVAMPRLGMGVGEIVFTNIILVPILAFTIGLVWFFGRDMEDDLSRLISGETWARWQLSPAEYQLYARSERNTAHITAAALFLIGVVVGVMTATITGDLLRGALYGGIFLIPTAITLVIDRAPGASTSDQTLDVLIGPRGARIGDRYLPFGSTGMKLQTIWMEYEEGTLPALVFMARIRVGHRRSYQYIRVPVPVDRIDEARTLVQRFNQQTEATVP